MRLAIKKALICGNHTAPFKAALPVKRPVNIQYGNYSACVYHLQGAELEPLVSKHLSVCEDSQEACAELLLLSQYVCCVFLEALGKPVDVFECLFPSLSNTVLGMNFWSLHAGCQQA